MNDTIIKESFCSSSNYLVKDGQIEKVKLGSWKKKNKTSFTVIKAQKH
ncbi:TPA: hypothetical protein ACQUHM_005063 [Bacillus thuringiensis]